MSDLKWTITLDPVTGEMQTRIEDAVDPKPWDDFVASELFKKRRHLEFYQEQIVTTRCRGAWIDEDMEAWLHLVMGGPPTEA